jgi:hypothetical protein
MQTFSTEKCAYGISVIKLNENKIVFGKNYVLSMACNRTFFFDVSQTQKRTVDLPHTNPQRYRYATETLG